MKQAAASKTSVDFDRTELRYIQDNGILPPLRFLTKIVCASLLSSMRATCTAHVMLLDLISLLYATFSIFHSGDYEE
jgi:hypothetical protein